MHQTGFKCKSVSHSVLWVTSYYGLYGEALPERGTCTFFRLQVYERIGISLVEVQKRVGKTDILVFKGLSKCF